MPLLNPKKWLQSPFIRQSFTLFWGSLLAQLFPLAITPLLTRFFTQAEFGTLALLTTLTSLFSSVACGRYEVAVMLPKSDKDARQLVWASLRIALLSTIFLFTLVIIAGTDFAQAINNSEVIPYLIYLPFLVAVAAVGQIFNYWQLRQRSFANISKARVLQGAGNALVSLFSGLGRFSVNGLIVGYGAGIFAQTTGLLISAWKSVFPKGWKDEYSTKIQRSLLHTYRDFPRINAPHTLVDLLQMAGVIALLTFYFGPAVAGMYGFCLRILQAPLNLIGAALGQVFFKEASERFSNGMEIRSLLLKTMKSLLLLSTVPFAVLLFFSAEIFATLFGEEWRTAGQMAATLSPWLLMQFILAPVSQLPSIVGKQGPVFFMSLAGNAIVISWIVAGGSYFDELFFMLKGLSVSMFIFYGLIILYFIKISSRPNLNFKP
jgi:O-antigen/teichoic acid export membrane protein